MKTGIRKYRKRPVIVEALRFDGDNDDELDNFVGENNVIYRNMLVFIDTLEGEMRVAKGDYVIKGVNGEFYPCKPDIFEKTYEETGKIYLSQQVED